MKPSRSSRTGRFIRRNPDADVVALRDRAQRLLTASADLKRYTALAEQARKRGHTAMQTRYLMLAEDKARVITRLQAKR